LKTRASRPARRLLTIAAGLLALGVYGLLVNAALTQYIAHYYGYHSALGEPLWRHVYAPWDWVLWQHRYFESARTLYGWVQVGFLVGIAVGFAGVALWIGFRTRSSRRYEGVHGTAHWATESEIRAAGLLPAPGRVGAGPYVGGWMNANRLHYLRHNGPEHIGVIAPTRSGKGVSLVIPTLLSYPHSTVIHEAGKGELWNLTAGWRGTEGGNEVLKFNPTALEGSVSFNPLAEVRLGTDHEVGDVQNIVTIIVDPDGRGLPDHWAKTAHAFLIGCVLYLLYQKKKAGEIASLPDVAFALSDPSVPIDTFYNAMVSNQDAPVGLYEPSPTHPVIAAAGRDMLDRPDEERGSVLSTAKSFLTLYRDPLIRRNTSRSDFKVSDLANRERPVSLYLVVSAEDKDRMKPLIRIILNQIVRVLLRPELQFEDGQPQSPHRHPLLLMLDEFPSLGRLEVFQESLAVIAAYGIKAYLIMQDIAQLWAIYGREQTIMSNLHLITAFAPNNLETAEWLSKETGVSTVIKEHISTSGMRFAAGPMQNISRDYQELSRPLLTVDEVLRLKGPLREEDGRIKEPGEVLVLAAGHAPILGTQTLYFQDAVFLKRSRVPPPDLASTPAKARSPRPEFVL
jgi:type IV secretion system protein VirD4